MFGLKTGTTLILMLIGGLMGAGVAIYSMPRIEVVEAADYVPVPQVEVTCETWVVYETAPDYYWDGPETEEQTSTADYWTVRTIGTEGQTIQSAAADRHEPIEVAASPYKRIVVAWFDSDRDPDGDQQLSQVGALVPDC